MSKGSSPRPYSVPLKEFDNNFDRIFRKPDPRVIEDAMIEDEAFNNIPTLEHNSSDQVK
jgi:D-hexose-6-phosphate mutarotase